MSTELPTISLFSGALGLDLGLIQAGFQVRVAVENNRIAAETIRLNQQRLGKRQGRPVALVCRDIRDVTTGELLDIAGLRRGEPALVTAGPCCQAFSTAGQRGSVEDPRGTLFREFLRVVREARPRFFVMENVRGVLSAAIRHRPLRRRGAGFPPLEPEEQLGSAFGVILRELRSTGYHCVLDLLNTADYGVPQTRERLIVIGSRDGEPIEIPGTTHARARENGSMQWVTLRQALRGLHTTTHEFTRLGPSKRRMLVRIPPGGNWRSLAEREQAVALGGAYESWGGRTGFFRRLSWDKPAPALTTRPDSKATMLCHPEELRPLSVQEYARLQQFPVGWVFAGGTPQKYKQIGNAVPVGLGVAVGTAILRAMRSRAMRRARGTILCRNGALLDGYVKRPPTILNPPRMRRVKNRDRTIEWVARQRRDRSRVIALIDRIPRGARTTGKKGRKAQCRSAR